MTDRPTEDGQPLNRRAVASLTRQVSDAEALCSRLEHAMEDITATTESVERGVVNRAARVLADLAVPDRPLKHMLREMDDQATRRVLLRALDQERVTVARQLLEGALLTWGSAVDPGQPLGPGLDERIVELPLAVEATAPDRPGWVLDAGAALNLEWLRPYLAGKASLVHVTQSGDHEAAMFDGSRASYLFADLRALPFRDDTFSRVLCISTLEHIGMDNRRYGGLDEDDPASALAAVDELVRVLAPDGRLMISVPFGRPRSLGWYRVFGAEDLEILGEHLASLDVTARFFAYDQGWIETDPSRVVALDTDAGIIRGLAVIRTESA